MTEDPHRPTVLIVEDDNLMRMDMADIFADAGFAVVEAWTGAMALRLLEQRPEIGLVFTDVRMPGAINGFALAHLLADRWPGTAVMVCSGMVTPRGGQLPVRARFFAKPFSHHEVAAVAHELLAA